MLKKPMIQNRIEKNYKKLKAWADKNQITAFRIYDRDIPEFPFIVDYYAGYLVIYDKSQRIDEEKNHLPILLEALKKIFSVNDEQLVIKRRQKQKGTEQYTKIAAVNKKISIKENGITLLVNLWDYLDTGVFLDHRPIRYQFLKKTQGHRFLNLFCYTATVSVMAAMGGATTYSVDLSNTYLDWAKENFLANNIELSKHTFLEKDVLQFLEQAAEWPDLVGSFDTIFLDPPTFSNSKSMKDDFEVEEDQIFLVESSMKLLMPTGTLFFSNNKRDFKISDRISANFSVKNITKNTLPIDFHDQKIHHCFEIKYKAQ